MMARSTDYRHLPPLLIDDTCRLDLRHCRNCGEHVVLHAGSPDELSSDATVGPALAAGPTSSFQ